MWCLGSFSYCLPLIIIIFFILVRTSALPFLYSWSYGVVLYEIFTVGKLTIVIIYDLVEAKLSTPRWTSVHFKSSLPRSSVLSRREAGAREKDIPLISRVFGPYCKLRTEFFFHRFIAQRLEYYFSENFRWNLTYCETETFSDSSRHHTFESENFRFHFFSAKNSLTYEVKFVGNL